MCELARLVLGLLCLGLLLLQVANPCRNRLVASSRVLLQTDVLADWALERLLLKVDVGHFDQLRLALLRLLERLDHVHLVLLLLLLGLSRCEVNALPRAPGRVLLLDNFDSLLFFGWNFLAIEPFEVRDSLQHSGSVLGLAAQWRREHTQLDDLRELAYTLEFDELRNARRSHSQNRESLALLEVHKRLEGVFVQTEGLQV